MDQIVVDCGRNSAVEAGDEVVLIGRQGGASLSASDWANALGTISYEVLCGIGPRVPRVVIGHKGGSEEDGVSTNPRSGHTESGHTDE
jgi:alanine racemase